MDIDHGGLGKIWDPGIKVAARKSREYWAIELAIPLAAMNVTEVKAGAQWGLNLCRNRKPPVAETSSWTHVGHSFHNPAGFGTLEFVDRQ